MKSLLLCLAILGSVAQGQTMDERTLQEFWRYWPIVVIVIWAALCLYWRWDCSEDDYLDAGDDDPGVTMNR
jgi:protein-S-isoprenylcysteine O-methyltransferase Ste14